MNLDRQNPLVSIGLPVYNGENRLRNTIESLLSQDYKNLELIISDNGSTDQTPDICHVYANKDKRVRYYRQASNKGASWNFKNVFDLSTGEYFMWAGHHDFWRPDFIRICKEVLDVDRGVVLCYTEIHRIDEKGDMHEIAPEHHDTRGLSMAKRVGHIVGTVRNCDMIYGLFRASVLKQCRLGLTCIGPDHVLLMEASLCGSIAEISKPGFLRYERKNTESGYIGIGQTLMRLDPNAANRKNIRPFWEWGLEHLYGIYESKIPAFKKSCLILIVAYAFWGRFSRLLLRELVHPYFKKGIGYEVKTPRY